MFRHDENDDSSDDSESSDNDEGTECDRTFINPSLIDSQEKDEDGKSKLLKFTLYFPCKEIFLANDKAYYTKELNDMEEIDKVDHLWLNSQSGMKVGTYLETYFNFYTSQSKKWKEDSVFRQKIWDRLNFRETNP